MSNSDKDTSMGYETKLTFLNDLSIVDTEHFEPPQLSSTPSKIIYNPKRIFKNNNRLNSSIINKKNHKKKEGREIDNQQLKSMLPIIENNFKCNQIPELFSDLNESLETNDTTTINDSNDKWITFSDVSEDKNNSNISGLLAEIEVESSFEKPPRRSYLGRKRNNTSLYQNENEKENDETEISIEKRDRKHKRRKYTDPQDEALIHSMNEHFNDVESFSLIVE